MDKTVAVRLIDCLQFIIPTGISLVTLIVAFLIPNKVMVNQIFAGLIASYRNPEMGAAILALFHFYKKDCNCDISKIEEKYRERYQKEVEPLLKEGKGADFSNTLHFQRRMVTQFYFNMAVLRFEHCFLTRLRLKKLKTWFTSNDIKLLSLILHMAKPAEKVFIKIDDLSEPPRDNVPMNKLIHKLYDEVVKEHR
jgi:hypothetical protein